MKDFLGVKSSHYVFSVDHMNIIYLFLCNYFVIFLVITAVFFNILNITFTLT